MLEKVFLDNEDLKGSGLRGIAPALLLDQVWNTAPYLKNLSVDRPQDFPFLGLLQNCPQDANLESIKWEDYFKLCLAAHYATVATFVPTDVDVHIRSKLWRPLSAGPLWEEEILPHMIDTILQAYHWDATWISARWLKTPSGRVLEGHKGEWFSVAAAAFGASQKNLPTESKKIMALIEAELDHEENCFIEFLKEKDWLGLLKASVLIAHNLGDLQRVMELWGLPHLLSSKLSQPAFQRAGQINRDWMAVENHRHFPLREPRALRKSLDFLLPMGPFLDPWGKTLATHPLLSLEDLGGIIEALVQGFYRLKGPVGYARALVGIESAYPGGLSELTKPLPSKVAKLWTSGPLRTQCAISETRFELQWIKRCQTLALPPLTTTLKKS